MSQPEPITVWEVPDPNTLTMVELDEVFAASGVDIQSLKANDMGKMLAALVVWVRQKAGEQVTFDEVYRTLTTAQIRTSKVDPTAPASTG